MKKLQKLRQDLPWCPCNYVLVFTAFDKVRMSCFSEVLIPSYKNDIIHFGYLCCNLKTSEGKSVHITPKNHVLIDHMPEFCERKGKGLGLYNE